MSRARASSTPRTVSVCVPASTSNCGAGFDTLGLALQFYSTVVVRRRRDRQVRPATRFAREGQEMAAEAAQEFFARSGTVPFGFDFHVRGAVPVARGLGSSVILRAGVVAALNVLSGAGLARDALLRIVTALEGHPDNAAPAMLGGFCVGRCDPETDELAGVVRRPVGAGLVFVVAVPEQRMPTTKARGVLPARLSHRDAVRSVNSASYVTAAFLTGEFERLKHAVSDFMHEPYRLPLIPGAREALAAGKQAGALTGWLSGSGSSVLAVARSAEAAAVARAMTVAFRSAGQQVRVHLLRADNRGLRIVARR
jgi:homoserine kinase